MVDLSDDEREELLQQLVRIVGTTNSMIAALSVKVDALQEKMTKFEKTAALQQQNIDKLV